MFCASAMTLEALPRWNSGTLSAKLAVSVDRTALAEPASTQARVSCSTSGENASQAREPTKTTTPPTIQGRRRPHRVRAICNRDDRHSRPGVRLYRPHPEILNGKWKLPEAQPVS